MTDRRLLLWRHGRTEWNAGGRMQGQTDVALDVVGVRQAREAAPLLAAEAPDAIVSSDLARARHTAEALAELTRLPVRLDARLRETNLGPWEGLTDVDVADRWPDAYGRWRRGEPIGLDGVEPPHEVAARTQAAIEDALAVTDGTLVVVSHGGASRRAIQAFLGWSDEAVARIGPLGNCRWSELRRTARGWRLYGHNLGPLTGWAGTVTAVPAADVEAVDPGVLTPDR